MSDTLTATRMNIFTRIRHYIQGSTATAEEIIKYIMDDLSPDGYEEALREILRRQIIVEMGLTRRKVTETMTHTKVNGSKREAIREAFFNQRIATQNGMKTIGSLTVDEVQWIAAKRYELAAATKEVGDKFTRLGEMMLAAQVTFVGQLDSTQVQDALS